MNSAETAANATNAGKVDGRDAACPVGMTAIAGLCYETGSRASASFGDAAKTCAAENRTLPTLEQLWAAIDELGNVAASFEWVSGVHEDGIDLKATALSGFESIAASDVSSSLKYRCVTPLVR